MNCIEWFGKMECICICGLRVKLDGMVKLVQLELILMPWFHA